jgi:hypothetical protein
MVAIDEVIRNHARYASRVSPPSLAAIADQYLAAMSLPTHPQS